MVDRVIVYPGQIPLDTDILSTQRNAMIALGFLAQATLGTSVVVDGLACTQQTVPNMTFNVGPGSIISLQNVDATDYGSLVADTVDPLLKMGINIAPTVFTVTAPGTTGQSRNYLIQAAFQETDANSVILPYYNASNPAVAYSGPGNSGTPQNTLRTQTVNLGMKTGTAATTGSQVTPTPDAGFVGLWVVTVAFGQTSVVATNIAKLAGAPFIGAARVPDISKSRMAPVTARMAGQSITSGFTITTTVSFTAPVAGYAFVTTTMNTSATSSIALTNTLLLNGSVIASDASLTSSTEVATQAVSAGANTAAVRISCGVGTPGVSASASVSVIFVPFP